MAKKNHPFECACCTHGKEAVDKMEQESIKKYGWYAHLVPEDYSENTPTGFNMHTHHLPESFDQLNLQIVVPVSSDRANVFLGILHDAVNNYVRKGIKLEAGKVYDNILAGGFKVTFVHARENGRPVLRMILPDKDGNITKDKIKEPYAVQYVGTELIN